MSAQEQVLREVQRHGYFTINSPEDRAAAQAVANLKPGRYSIRPGGPGHSDFLQDRRHPTIASGYR
jgi:hypothetical protein